MNFPDPFLVVFMKLIDDEPRRYGTRIRVHVQDKKRPAHRQNLDNEQRTEPKKIMIDPDQLIPVLRGVLFFGFFPQLDPDLNIMLGPLETFLADMREHLRIHLDLVQCACAVCVHRADLVDVAFPDVAVGE